MKFVLSGEGPTDIGKIDNYTRSFDPGPMTYFIDAVVYDKTGISPLENQATTGDIIHFIPKQNLGKQNIKTKVVFPGKRHPQETGYFIKNAQVLAQIAKKNSCETGLPTVAVLFRDADTTRSKDEYEVKWDSMMNGFKRAGFDYGVPMIPRQIMEAWLLDSLDWQGEPHPDFEKDTGGRHSADPYKEQLKTKLKQTSQQDLVDKIQDGILDQSRITVESYKRFKTRLEDVLDTI
ncbi:MAG TPA: hypothetical protein VJ869_17450 [Sphaerochaeta sp.]|nr:hypothetical protein [Sphaerochaeta sp.]